MSGTVSLYIRDSLHFKGCDCTFGSISQAQIGLRWNPMVSDSLFLKKNHTLPESGKILSSGSRSLCSSSACVPAVDIITGCETARSTKEKEEEN